MDMYGGEYKKFYSSYCKQSAKFILVIRSDADHRLRNVTQNVLVQNLKDKS